MNLNQHPIFLNCFSRGGSNIFWNIFLSHPDVVSPIEETLQIFRWDWRAPRWAGLKAILLSRQPGFFDQWALTPRRPLGPVAGRFLDAELHRWKLKTLTDSEMVYKSETERYTPAEVQAARLCAKNNNGLVFLTAPLAALYPGARFFALAREPLALYESHLRRRTPPSASPEQFADFYNTLVNQMLADQAAYPGRAFLFRFEDLLADPAAAAHTLYTQAGLDPARAPRLRFKAKPHLTASGEHTTPYQEGRHYWFAPADVHQILETEINSFQSSRVPPADRDTLLSLTAETRAALGY